MIDGREQTGKLKFNTDYKIYFQQRGLTKKASTNGGFFFGMVLGNTYRSLPKRKTNPI